MKQQLFKESSELIAQFVAQLEQQPGVGWWDQFVADEPEAAQVAKRVSDIIAGRDLKALTDDQISEVEQLLVQFEDLAAVYAAGRGESVPPR